MILKVGDKLRCLDTCNCSSERCIKKGEIYIITEISYDNDDYILRLEGFPLRVFCCTKNLRHKDQTIKRFELVVDNPQKEFEF